MKKILITGADGQLGVALNQVLKLREDVKIIHTDVSVLDIANEQQVMDYINQYRPDIVINCAAHTAVDLCETDQENARRINGIGPRNLALATEKVNSKLIQVSTDYVFDGNKEKPYVETDQPNPQSVYGFTKLEGEREVQKYCSRYFIVRTAWLYGEGKNFVKTMIELGKTKEFVRVVKDQYGTPTSAIELAKMIAHIMETENYGIYHGTCEGDTNWCEFAMEIFGIMKMNIEVLPVTSQEYKTVAKRPKYSVLENKKLNEETSFRMSHWKTALKEYLLSGNSMIL